VPLVLVDTACLTAHIMRGLTVCALLGFWCLNEGEGFLNTTQASPHSAAPEGQSGGSTVGNAGSAQWTHNKASIFKVIYTRNSTFLSCLQARHMQLTSAPSALAALAGQCFNGQVTIVAADTGYIPFFDSSGVVLSGSPLVICCDDILAAE
jgi:hypothetical protein